MSFPLWINNKLKFNIDDIGVSSEKLMINHIEKRLKDMGMVILKKRDNSLIYHKGGLFHIWRRKDFIDNGFIKIEVKHGEVLIKLQSMTAGFFMFSLLFGSFFLLDDVTSPRWKGALIVFGILFGFNFIVRYIAHLTLKDEIKELILGL